MEKIKKEESFGGALIWFLLFIIFTALVKFIDIQPVGPDGSMIGFATINQAIWNKIGINDVFYNITQCCGIIAIAIAFVFAVIGLSQLLKSKSLKGVDPKIIAMGIYYIIVMAFYALFMFVAINYRPVYIDATELESSYPSSHTMLALTVVAAFVMYNNNFKNIKNPALRTIILTVCFLFGVLTVIGRLVCGVHWFTDIIGSVILSIAIIKLYDPLCRLITKIVKSK